MCGRDRSQPVPTAGHQRPQEHLQTQLHQKAPFGVVGTRITVEVKQDGAVKEKLTITLKLAAAGSNAKSEIAER